MEDNQVIAKARGSSHIRNRGGAWSDLALLIHGVTQLGTDTIRSVSLSSLSNFNRRIFIGMYWYREHNLLIGDKCWTTSSSKLIFMDIFRIKSSC